MTSDLPLVKQAPHLQLLTRYTRLGASSRLRMLQYVPALERAGFTVSHDPFFDDEYLRAKYSNQSTRASLPRAVVGRLQALRKRPDLIWLEYEALPWVPWAMERQLWPRGTPVVVDYDDAIFHRYDRHRSAGVRWALGSKIDHIMATAHLVTAGNAYLADRARAAGAKRVEIVPTVVDLDVYDYGRNVGSKRDAPPVVGWIGTPGTWTELARQIYAVLQSTLLEHGAIFNAVGAALEPHSEGSLDIRPWSEATEVAEIKKMDIGVMPLPDTPWTRGKCAYKLLQYMACGLPVVASPVGVNKEIVEHGVNGFLASTDHEWGNAIDTLLSNSNLRSKLGSAGRRKVESGFSLQAWESRTRDLVRELVQ